MSRRDPSFARQALPPPPPFSPPEGTPQPYKIGTEDTKAPLGTPDIKPNPGPLPRGV